ncbi:MAG: tetratricopeptide repeat protein, partial [Chitinophagaceae bacterium]
MNKFILILALGLFSANVSRSQPPEVKQMHETAKAFMRTGDFDNAILVLKRALEQDKDNLELQKDLVMSYYLKRDYAKALEGVKSLTEREDADVVTF